MTGWRSLAHLLIESADGPGWRVEWRGGSFITAAGEGHIVLPHTEHRLTMLGPACHSTWSVVDCSWSDGRDPLDGRRGALRLGRSTIGTVRHLLSQMAGTGDDGWENGLRRQCLQRELLLAIGLPWQQPRTLDPRIQAIVLAIDDQPSRHRACSELAADAGLGLAQFHALFRQETGMPPLAWMARRRMRLAQDLLATTTLPVAQVAERCGYADPFHFSRVFRRHTGQPPRVYRDIQGR